MKEGYEDNYKDDGDANAADGGNGDEGEVGSASRGTLHSPTTLLLSPVL